MLNTRMERIENNLRELGAGFAVGNKKGNYRIHPMLKQPYEKDIVTFTTLSNLERWIQIKKELLKEEKSGQEYSMELLQELDILEKGIV